MARLLLALAPRMGETKRMAKPTIRVLHHLARSGGTLISKCLGSMEGVFLLSEIHPLTEQVDAAYTRMVEAMNPLRQAIEWHRLPTEHDLRKLGKRERVEFSELLVLLAERAQSRGGALLVRDWTHLDFIARPFLPEPTLRLTTAEELRQVAEVESHITVRHPVDQLVSLSKLGVMQGSWDLREYFYAYRVFAEVAREVGFTRYEDFTRDPDGHLRRMCAALALPFDPGYADRWPDYRKITGDNSSFRTIQPVHHKELEPEQMEKIRALPDYQQAVALFGYEA